MQQFFELYGPKLIGFGMLGLFFVMMALALYLGYQRMQSLRESWDTVGMRTGLKLDPGTWFRAPRLSGEYRRRNLLLDTFTRSSGRNQVTYSRVTLSVSNSGGGRMGLSPEGFLSGLGKALGMQDVPIGSERFDKSFMIRSTPPEFATGILADSMLQDSLLQLKDKSSFELNLDGGSLTYVMRGFLRDPDTIVAIFNTLSDMAERVEGGKRSSMF